MASIRKTRHEALVKAVEVAIENLFSDTTCDPEQTRDDLRGIIDDCEIKLSTLVIDDDEDGPR